jgi:hypothetical protein
MKPEKFKQEKSLDYAGEIQLTETLAYIAGRNRAISDYEEWLGSLIKPKLYTVIGMIDKLTKPNAFEMEIKARLHNILSALTDEVKKP